MTRDFPPDSRRYRFGPYTFDSGRGLLWREGTRIALTPKTADVLRVLIEHRGDVIEKSDLLHFVWPNTFVEENNLARHISMLRKVLQERRGQHDIISTIPGHGYMFVAPVVELPAEPLADKPIASAADEVGASVFDDKHSGETTEERPHGEVTATIAALQPPLPRPRWYAAAAALFVVAVGAAVLVTVRTSTGPNRRDIDLRQLTFDGQLQRDPAWSPDGTALVYATDRAGNLDLYRRSMSDPTPIRLTSDPADESEVDWSPDGRWLAYRSEADGGGIYVMPAGGGNTRRVANAGHHPRWSPDGSRLLLMDSTPVGIRGFRIVAVSAGATRDVRPDVVAGFRSAFAGWHPDGRRLSIAGRTSSASWTFVTVTVDGNESIVSRLPAAVVERLRDRRNTLGRFLWSRSGTRLYFEGRLDGAHSIWQVDVDPKTLAWAGEPERLYSGPGEYADLALSPDGRRLAFTVSNQRTRVWSFPFDPGRGTLTGGGQPLTSGGPGEYDAAAPLDGSKVAYRTIRGNRYELWQRSVSDGGEHLVSASSEWMPTSPRWSRDGTQLAYLRRLSHRRPDVTPAVAIHTASGTERLLRLPGETEVVPDDWSSDNEWLLGACRQTPLQPMGTCLMAVGTAGIAEVRLVAADATRSLLCQRFSPDERWISFMAVDWKRKNVSTIYVMPSSGGTWIPVTDGTSYDDKPRWSPDGSAVYYLSSRDGALNLWGQRFDKAAGRTVGDPFRVTSFKGVQQALPSDLGRVEIAISASQLFLPLTETSGAIWMLGVK
jgi:Tol biopolymer transport system component/DNA-binding winged helix-turn-helix (wHTH) protein